MSEWTDCPWNYHIREMTDACGNTRRKCFIEKGGVALAQFANFGDEDEANARLCAVAPELYRLLKEAVDLIEYNFKGQDDVADFWIKEVKDALRIASGEKR